MSFDKNRKGTGTKEWAEVNENICRGCINNCLYCYAAHNANRFKMKMRNEWDQEELTKRAHITSYPARDGVVMFPSSHDITPFNLKAYIRVAKLILEKGNKLLIVSKPRMECVERMVQEFSEFKEQILFRFTIGCLGERTSRFWEPGAPLPSERIECLKHAFNNGYQTSVSMEPMLAGLSSAVLLFQEIKDFITDTVWIGKMNKPRLRVDMTKPLNVKAVDSIESMQNDDSIITLHGYLKDEEKVRWKDSIKTVIASREQP